MAEIFAADEPGELAGALDVAVRERVLVESVKTRGRYAFSHALIRQTLYSRIGERRRARLHCQVAEAIEDSAGDAVDEYLPELAYHFVRCAHERAAKAVHYALRAGQASLALLSHQPAAGHFAQALDVLDGVQVPDAEALRCEATIGLGQAQARAGDDAHRQTLLEGARQAERLGDSARLARAALANGRGMFSVTGTVDEERLVTLRAALEHCPPQDGVLRARLLAQLAMERIYDGDWDARKALSDEALALARELGDTAALVTVLYQRSAALWGVHGLRERLAAALEAEPLLDRIGDPALSFLTVLHGAHAAIAAGDMQLADRRLAALPDHAAMSGQPTHAWYVLVAQSKRAISAGRLAQARRLAFEAAALGEASGQPDARAWCASQVFGVRFLQSRLQDADHRAIPTWIEQCPSLHLFLDAQLACMQSAHGRTDDARRTLARVMAGGLEDVPKDFGWISTVALAGYACWQLGERDHAGRVVEVLAPWAQHFVDMGPAWLGSASHFLGLLAITCDEPRQAHARFEVAAAMHERCGADACQAHTYLAWSQLLRRHAVDGAPDPSELAREALRISTALELTGPERRARELLTRSR